MLDYIHIDFFDGHRLGFILLDIAIAIGLILTLRFLSGWVSHVKSLDELAKRDNFAFGISLAGGILALIVMMTGLVSENFTGHLGDQLRLLIGYGVLGVALIKCGRMIQDLIVFRGISIPEEILKGNKSAAILDLANALVTAMVVRSVMAWVDIQGITGVVGVIGTFLGAQLVVGCMTLWWMNVYHRRHPEGYFTQAIQNDNRALATRYACHTLGASLALGGASGMIYFDAAGFIAQGISVIVWLVCGILLCGLISLLARFGRLFILSGVNIAEEVDVQDNLAVALVEGALYLSIGLYFFALLNP